MKTNVLVHCLSSNHAVTVTFQWIPSTFFFMFGNWSCHIKLHTITTKLSSKISSISSLLSKVKRDPSTPLLSFYTCHTSYVTLSVSSILIHLYGSKTSITCFLWFITHTQHGIWDWCKNLVLSKLMSVNWLLVLCSDSNLISIALFN